MNEYELLTREGIKHVHKLQNLAGVRGCSEKVLIDEWHQLMDAERPNLEDRLGLPMSIISHTNPPLYVDTLVNLMREAYRKVEEMK